MYYLRVLNNKNLKETLFLYIVFDNANHYLLLYPSTTFNNLEIQELILYKVTSLFYILNKTKVFNLG